MIALYVAALSYGKLAADKSFDRLLGGSALSIVETLSIIDGKVRVDIPYSALDMLSAAPDDRVFYRVIGPDGNTVTGYHDLPGVPTARGSAGSEAQARFSDAQYRGEGVRFVSLAREIAQPGTTGWVYVQVGQTRQARDALARELVFQSLAPILLMTIVALGVVWFSVSLALRPIRRLGAELAGRQPEDLGSVTTPVPGEIAPVADSINTFMLRLRDSIDTLRSFIADAAHQIRTPLAAIQAQAEIGEDGNQAEMRSSLAAVRRNAAKLTRLVNQMLSDATMQHRSDVREFTEFDLVRTIEQGVREAVPVAEDSDVRFTSGLAAAPVLGDRLMVGEVVKNLVQNALLHGRSDEAEVLIELLEESGGYLLSVSDRGPGIAPSDIGRVFERFERGANNVAGAGLGLPIVRRAVLSHGGTIELVNRVEGGLRVEIRLPRSAART